MTIVNTLDRIAEWLEANVCADVQFKPRSVGQDTGRFDYKLVHPTVFPLYLPTSTNKPPHVEATTPSICVQIVEGSDDAFKRQRTTKLHLSFSTWSPGIHGPDLYTPQTDVDSPTFSRVYERGKDGTFRPSHDGWRDVWNFVDVALRAIESARSIDDYTLDPSEPIKYGAYDEDGAIYDYYPFWCAWVEFAIKDQVTSADLAIGDLLY